GDGTTSISCNTESVSGSSVDIYISCNDSSGNKDTASTNTQTSYSVVRSVGGGAPPSYSSLVSVLPPLSPIIEQIVQIPEKAVEKVVEQIKEIPGSIAEQSKKITEQITQIQKQLVKLIKPAEEKQTEIVVIPEKAQLSLDSKWNLLPVEAIKRFVLYPLPTKIKLLAQKFPELEKTFKNVGIAKITDVQKLTNTNLKIPGLTQTLGLSQVEITPGKFTPPKGIPINKLPATVKQQLPSEIVFAKTGGELIDFDISLSVAGNGEPQQKIRTISGKPLQLVIKPDKPVKSVKGYVVFKSKASQPHSLEVPLNYLLASVIFANPVFAKVQEQPIKVEEKLVLLEFEYTDPDGDGIYTADINAPVIDGEYEIITVMDFEDPELGKKEIRLITVIDPEGYVYEKSGNKETRIPGAIVSIFWLNSETKQYELWPARDYQQENPQTTDVRGTYSFLVPEGYYYLKVDAPGYLSYDGKPFGVAEGSGVHINLELKTKYWWTKIVDWKTILLAAIIILLLYNFYRDKIRERIIARSKV
ncbi:MAG: carboxypeptidase regulatory-like domain-containing protein, partial [Candidatus Staskawiczbacteria bacterium]|nr:carboxypeptidase regulatory-like domain-containing protein [Candidatus Staskawiczbacteria bacterium]